ncbi:MAG TPA: type VI secretion system baseplate subunit TssG [Pyrinomonadaceae bacterium]|jgi:type VI secretion system protein ImpH
MAFYGWGQDNPVDEWLFAEGYRFDFFQAVRLLEMSHSAQASVGEGADPGLEAVRFKSGVGLDFSASDVAEVKPPLMKGKPAEMTVNFLGLAGCLGPLAIPSTELILERTSKKDTAFRDFLDIFNHRLVSLLYRIRKLHRVGLESKPPGQDRISRYIYSVMGLGTHGLQGRMQIRDRALLYYAGLLGQQPRSMTGLEFILADYFEVPARGHQFEGRWYRLEESQWTTIGEAGQNHVLGREMVVAGTRVWEQQGRFEIALGPLTQEQFLDFLPTGWGFGPLCDLTRFYIGDELEFSFRLTLKANEVPEARLCMKHGPRLGWTSWLKTEEWTEDDSQVAVSPYYLRANTQALRIPLFFGLPPDKLSELIARMTPRKYPKHSVIIRQGEPGASMFAIRSGAVHVVRREDDGKELLLNTLREGDCFGHRALISGKVRSATIIAIENSEILELDKKDLDDFIAKYPRLEKALQAYYDTQLSNSR